MHALSLDEDGSQVQVPFLQKKMEKSQFIWWPQTLPTMSYGRHQALQISINDKSQAKGKHYNIHECLQIVPLVRYTCLYMHACT